MAFGVVLHSMWLLPVLAVLIAVDGPLPVLPSETLLLAALAVGITDRDLPALAGLFLVAVGGSMVGDLTVFGLGRSSRRVFARAAANERHLAGWVRRNVLARPGVTIVGARFLPGGRLVSTVAAGRYGLALPAFLPWSLVSSLVWASYMTVVAMLIDPFTDGSPLAALLAGIVIALLTAGTYTVAKAIRRIARAEPTVADDPELELVRS